MLCRTRPLGVTFSVTPSSPVLNRLGIGRLGHRLFDSVSNRRWPLVVVLPWTAVRTVRHHLKAKKRLACGGRANRTRRRHTSCGRMIPLSLVSFYGGLSKLFVTRRPRSSSWAASFGLFLGAAKAMDAWSNQVRRLVTPPTRRWTVCLPLGSPFCGR